MLTLYCINYNWGDTMKNNNSIIMMIIGILTLLVAVTSATIAYFSATSTTNPQIITTSSLNLTVETDGDSTHVTNIKPTTWSNTLENNINNSDISKIPFKVVSPSSTNGVYNIKLGTISPIVLNETDVNGTLSGGSISDIKYKIYTKTGVAVGTEGFFSDTMGTPTNYKEIISGNLSSELNDEYILYVYIENTQSDIQNKLQGLDFTVVITGSAQQS